jgi:plastocyanin
MRKSWTRKSTLRDLSLAGVLCVSSWGCGGSTEVGDAVVVPPPGSGPVAAPTTTAAAPAAGSPAAAPAPTPAATPAATPVKAEGWGTLKGQVVLSGDAPAAKVLVEKGKASKNPELCAADAPILSEHLIVDAGTKGVKNVLVYIPKPTAVNPEAKKAASEAKVVFDQAKCIFEPHVLAAMTNVPITLKSSDPVNHNVNLKLKNTQGNKLLSGGASETITTTGSERTPGMVTCDIHPWMQAWWMILDSPYFAVTDAKGNFEIKNVPAGTQKVVVWQEALTGNGFVTPPTGEDVDVKPNDTTTKDYKVEVAKLRAE